MRNGRLNNQFKQRTTSSEFRKGQDRQTSSEYMMLKVHKRVKCIDFFMQQEQVNKQSWVHSIVND